MPEIVPGLLAVGVFLAWSASEGGFGIRSTSLGAVFLLGLLAVSAIVYRPRLREIPVASLVALALLGCFAAWNFLSIAWADVNDVAWEGANRTLLYFVVFALFTIGQWRSGTAATVLGVFSFGVAAIGLASLLETTNASDPRESFITGRWIDPTGYHNASAALYLSAFFPAVFLASRRPIPWIVRGAMLAVAGVLLQLALIPQSRGALIAFPIALCVYLLLVPGRVRSLVAIAPIAGVMAVTAQPLLDVYIAVGEPGDPTSAIEAAVRATALSGLALFVIGGAWAALDSRLELPRQVTWAASRALAVIAVVAVVGGGAAFVVEQGDPVQWADERWEDFKSGTPERFESSRFGGSLGTNRYDFWRVSVDEFTRAPLVGMGADNFAVPYLRERRSPEEPLHPHSLPIRVLSQTGLVGAALFVGFMLAALVAAARVRWRRDDPTIGPGLAAVAVVSFSYWFIHGTGEWLWTFPALTAPVLAWLAIGGRLEPRASKAASRRPEQEAPRPGRLWRGTQIAAVALAACVALVSFVLPWAAATDMETAATGWGADPEAAFDRLERARKLNFLSGEPDLLAGTIAVRTGEEQRARLAFERALERNSHSWYARLQLGSLDAVDGRRAAALEQLRAASRLSPDDPLIALALRRTRMDRPVSPQRIQRELVARVCSRVGIATELADCR